MYSGAGTPPSHVSKYVRILNQYGHFCSQNHPWNFGSEFYFCHRVEQDPVSHTAWKLEQSPGLHPYIHGWKMYLQEKQSNKQIKKPKLHTSGCQDVKKLNNKKVTWVSHLKKIQNKNKCILKKVRQILYKNLHKKACAPPQREDRQRQRGLTFVRPSQAPAHMTWFSKLTPRPQRKRRITTQTGTMGLSK